jgi:hypothetical protein
MTLKKNIIQKGTTTRTVRDLQSRMCSGEEKHVEKMKQNGGKKNDQGESMEVHLIETVGCVASYCA